MTERWYRLVQGIYLIVALYIENDAMIYTFIGLLTFEALTNLRLPGVITRLTGSGESVNEESEVECYTFSIDSERLLRVFVVLFLVLSYVLFPELVWFFPWFVGAMLLLAGITNICPMVMMFQFVGFK
ncbi:YgaP family membrane protein [Kaarinaea lacus]